jgi:outer membrane protein assembly factor BamB
MRVDTHLLSGLAPLIEPDRSAGRLSLLTDLLVPSPSVVSGVRRDLYVIYHGVAYCFDGRNGKVIWQTPVSTRAPINDQSKSTLLHVVSGVVYVVLTFDIYALDARNGKQIWHVVNHTENGYFWTVVDDGRVYLYSLDQTFSALNAANGSLLWHNTAFTTGDGYGFHIRHGHLYTQRHTNRGRDCELVTLVGVTGEIRWSALLPQTAPLSEPLVKDGVVYIAAGEFFCALKEQGGESIWEQAVPNTFLYNPYLVDGILYAESPALINFRLSRTKFSSELPHIVALNAQTGQLLWTVGPGYRRLKGAFQWAGHLTDNRSSLAIVDGLLLVSHEEYEQIEGTGESAKSAQYQYRGPEHIVGLDARTGREVQLYPLQNAVWGEILDNILYLVESVDLPQEQGALIAKRAFILKQVHPNTGQLLSEHPLVTEQNTFPVDGTGNGLLYQRISVSKTEPYPSREYRFVAYHLHDGSLAWSYAMPLLSPQTSSHDGPESAPVLAP